MTHNSPVNFKLMHLLLWIKGPNKCPKFQTFECALLKICQILHVISCHCQFFKSVFLQILHQSSVESNITLLYFFSSNIIYFGQKEPIKVQIVEIFECWSQKLLNSSWEFLTDQSIPIQILHHSLLSWQINPL